MEYNVTGTERQARQRQDKEKDKGKRINEERKKLVRGTDRVTKKKRNWEVRGRRGR